jgi:hypothetical protein
VTRPLILTAGFDHAGQARFDAARRMHFPPDRNHVPAHLTLFHALPGNRLAQICTGLDAHAAEHAPMEYRVDGVLSLGTGCAYRIDAPGLPMLHRALRARWAGWLTGQDRQTLRPHVTVQNKVTRARARATLTRLRASFVPWTGRVETLELWHYDGGPWQHAARFRLRGKT